MKYPCKYVRVNLAGRVKKFCDVAHSKKSLPTTVLNNKIFLIKITHNTQQDNINCYSNIVTCL